MRGLPYRHQEAYYKYFWHSGCIHILHIRNTINLVFPWRSCISQQKCCHFTGKWNFNGNLGDRQGKIDKQKLLIPSSSSCMLNKYAINTSPTSLGRFPNVIYKQNAWFLNYHIFQKCVFKNWWTPGEKIFMNWVPDTTSFI